ncbi:MAG: SufS family cysteine desulfurase [Bifidobacteriaceae bacterium]|jgi:cysteine desulfurase/selenocysteine lyase|nr:SufS family cysteine desulfurase [Bifidobacteriaceae bacterium]
MTDSLALSDIELAAIRADFPLLGHRLADGKELVYLDTAATSQRPRVVEEAMREFTENHNAAVHRGAHQLAAEATLAYEAARAGVADFLGASPEELVFTSGTTAGINLLVASFLAASGNKSGGSSQRFAVGPGDRIVVTEAEHHSNLVPWQRLAQLTGAELAWLPVDSAGRIRLDEISRVIGPRSRIVAFTGASNVSGAVTPVAPLVDAAHQVGALTVMDAAQLAPHQPLDVGALRVDFAVLSAHKMLGPNGIGGLYGRAELLQAMPPGSLGGSMVEIVTMREATFQPPPARFEAGTQAVTQAVGWAAAIAYLNDLGMDRVAAQEHALTSRLLAGLARIPGLRVLGPAEADGRIGAVALEIEGVHPHDAGQFLDAEGIAVRVGHHCAQPIHRAMGVTSSTRASLGLYNTALEVDRFLDAVSQVRSYFGVGR